MHLAAIRLKYHLPDKAKSQMNSYPPLRYIGMKFVQRNPRLSSTAANAAASYANHSENDGLLE